MYSSTQLLWVKNVKRDKGTGWAYDEFRVGDIFNLHWSEQFKGNVLKAPIGDLILIFQTVNNPKGTYLTHIVTPIDNDLGLDPNSSHPHTRRVGIVAMADPISSIPKPLNLDFKQPNRGACCHLLTIKDYQTKASISVRTLQEHLWGLFPNRDVSLDTSFNTVFVNTDDDDDAFPEGEARKKYKLHKYYERNPAVVKRKKDLAKKQGTLHCEVCGFNFSQRYPQVGNGFIECHHKTPMSTGIVRTTTIEDLALVCANCHRMLHRIINGDNLTIEQLTNIYNRI